jgi:photosystem II stability/assembly factor-like uncharacterized protein
VLKSIIAFLNFIMISSLAQSVQFSAAPKTVFHTLKIGAGGFIHDLDIQCDQGVGRCAGSGTTTKVARTDTYGAYWLNPNAANCGNAAATGCWQQLITATSFPDSLFNTCFEGCGAYEIRIAPSNTAHFYMYGPNGYVYGSTNHGQAWMRTGFGHVSVNPNDGTTASFGPFMAVDPANENIVVTGTPSSGAFYTTNGGDSWTRIAGLCTPTVPSGASQGGGYLISFDPTSTISHGATQGVYISCYGTGVYHSTTGVGGAFSLMTGSPTTHQHMIVDNAGVLWLIDHSGGASDLNKYAFGSWSNIKTGLNGSDGVAVAVDPANANNIVVATHGGYLVYSTNGGSTWNQPYLGVGGTTRIASDIPWLANTNEIYMTEGNILYDPAQSGVMYFAEGIGIWYTTNALTPHPAWLSQSAAIEQLVAIWIISPPGGGSILTAMDRPEWLVTSPDQVYPSHHGIDDNHSSSIIEGYSVDWCSSTPGTIVLLARGSNNNGEYSGISKTGGTYNGWTPFTSLGTPPPQSSSLHSGGAVACSGPNNIVWELGNNGGLYYTTDGGKTWSESHTGLPQNDPGWHGGNFLDRQNVIADRVNTSTFYAYNSGGVAPGMYKSTDGGETFVMIGRGHFDNNDRFNAQMRSVPGNAGNFYYTSGNDRPEGVQRFYECKDLTILSCPAVPQVTDVWSFGFGKAKPGGNGYPTIFIYGKVNGAFGLWRSDDHHATWVKLSGELINDSRDQVKVIEGDSNIYGTVYVGFNGSGFAYGALQ